MVASAVSHRLLGLRPLNQGHYEGCLDCLNVDELTKDVVGRSLISLTDIFLWYANINVHEESQDMTDMQTPFGLLRQTILL